MYRLLGFFTVLLIVSLPACNDRVMDPPLVDPPEAGARLSGQVINRSTGEPVAGAAVSADEVTSTSDADGRFVLENLPHGTVTVRTSAAGFEDFEQAVELPTNWIQQVYLTRIEVLEFDNFAIYTPAKVGKVRGVLLALGGPDTRAFATAGSFGAPVAEVEAALQTLGTGFRKIAVEEHMAILGTSLMALPNEPATDRLLLDALTEAARISGRPDVATAPLLLYGMSGGAPPASGLSARSPGRTIGLFLKVPAGIDPSTGTAAPSVPAFVTLAADDAFVDNAAIVSQFADGRGAGALWALATERGVPHHSLTDRHRELTLRWMRDVLDLRLGTLPGRLIAIGESAGFLGDPSTGELDGPEHFSGDPRTASWLPSWETAGRWHDFGAAAGPTAASLRTAPSTVTVREGWTGFMSVWVRDATGAAVWDPAVTYSSDREDVARADFRSCDWYCDAGLAHVEGVSEGVATITVTYGQDTGTVTVNVLPAVTFDIVPAEATIPVGGTVDLAVRVIETGSGTVVAEPEFAIDWGCGSCWQSQSPYIAVGPVTVSADGLAVRVTGIAKGQESLIFSPRGVIASGSAAIITVE